MMRLPLSPTHLLLLFGLLLIPFLADGETAVAQPQNDLCTAPFLPVSPPLTDLGGTEYIRLEDGPTGFRGGLYPNGRNQPPPAHAAAGLAQARAIQPRNAAGNPDPEGLIGLISIGMSNTFMEFKAFEELAAADTAVNPQVAIVNGAQAGQVAQDWADPAAGAWDFLEARLNHRRVTPQQVQVAWLKQVNTGPGDFPEKPQALQADLEAIVQTLKLRFPNLQIVYLSSRTRSYTYWNGLSPEPAAFESGFAVKWLIEAQINGDPALNFGSQHGAVVAPYLAWGPYLWVDGENARADGAIWPADQLRRDCTHPSEAGAAQVGAWLLDFFKTEATAVSWFNNPPEGETAVSSWEYLRTLKQAAIANGSATHRHSSNSPMPSSNNPAATLIARK